MKIFYDGSIFLRKSGGGVNRLFEEVTSRLSSGANNIETYLHRFPGSFGASPLKREYFKLPVLGGALMKYDLLVLMLKMRKFRPDILHSTYYRMPANTDCLKVITVCEMRREIFPDKPLPSAEKKLLKMKRFCLEKADRIIAVSGNVRREITRIYGIEPGKVSVVYPGISEIFKPATDEEKQAFILKHNLNLNFILFTGNRGGHKNFDLLLRAFSRWRHGPEFELICIGPEWSARETKMIKSMDIASNVRLIKCSGNDELKVFYSLASAFVCTSRCEGFSSPIAEAMACGAPVIAAAAASLPEIAGNAAQYFEPDSEAELLAALSRVAQDKRLRRNMREQGIKRSTSFNWDKTARETYEVYKKLLHG